MIPYKSIIQLDRKSKQPLYIQLANQIISLIKNQTLTSRVQLPGSRTLANLIYVHRKTIIACYDELIMQGWLESIPKKGTFVHAQLPILNKQVISNSEIQKGNLKSGFSFDKKKLLKIIVNENPNGYISLNDGVCDERLAPTEEISKIYSRLIRKKHNQQYLSYGSTYGNPELRKVLVQYLNETRGLKITEDNILITRGSQMGIYLSAQLLIKKNDCVIVGETNYKSADISFLHAGGKLLRVPVDENGLNTDAIEKLCQKNQIKAVYTTSHHHHPTTVTLSAERRIHLLNLSQQYHFAILEDDYDYDFHYNHAPIMPLASHDTHGNVIYIGSVCKTVAPVFRVGYLVASKDFVDSCARFRGVIDRQGDSMLELAFAHYIKNGDLDRHIKKLIKIYKVRRDLFCSLLEKELSHYFQFEIPKGGMAIWLQMDKKYSWENVAEAAKEHQLHLGNWQNYINEATQHNAIRIGFSTYNEDEIQLIIHKLKKTMELMDQMSE